MLPVNIYMCLFCFYFLIHKHTYCVYIQGMCKIYSIIPIYTYFKSVCLPVQIQHLSEDDDDEWPV